MNRNNQFLNSLMISELDDDDSGEMIQLISPEEDEDIEKLGLPSDLPILPIKNTVLFPGVVIPITVGRQRSIRLVKKAYRGKRIIGVSAQKNNSHEEPGIEDVYRTGTVAKIIKMLILPDGNTTIIIQGKKRFEVESFVQEEPFITAKVKLIEESFPDKKKKETRAIVHSLKDAASKILKLNPEIPQEAQVALDNIESPSFLTHFLSSNISADVADKQKLLEINDGMKRATLLLEYMLKDIQMLELKQEIHNKVHTDIDQQQRDYYLRQQMKVLQDELGFDGPDQTFQQRTGQDITDEPCRGRIPGNDELR
jgi:ATP-dependent Lon protease